MVDVVSPRVRADIHRRAGGALRMYDCRHHDLRCHRMLSGEWFVVSRPPSDIFNLSAMIGMCSPCYSLNCERVASHA